MKAKKVQAIGVGRLTSNGKRRIADAMYSRGLAFLGAGALLSKMLKKKEQFHGRADEPGEYTLLHLLCQGLEIVLKGLLLMHDFDKYQPLLKDKFGHDLKKLIKESVAEGIIDPPSPDTAKEIAELNKFFIAHRLRYAHITDLFFNPLLIPISNIEAWFTTPSGWLNKVAVRVETWRKTGAAF